MQPRLAYGFCALLLIAGTTLVLASPQSAHGPLASFTGAPGFAGKPEEFNCTLCHFSETNNLDTPGGGVEILGVPDLYVPGQTYPLTVRLRSDSTAGTPTRKWGFQITAARKSNGEGIGTFFVPNPDTLQVVPGEPGDYASRRYVEHTFLGTRDGLGGPVQWTFSWQAPAASSGMIYFFCAGNAAGGNDDPGFDFIYTTRDSTIAINTLAVGGALGARTMLALPRPNPARGPVRLDFTLAQRGAMDLSLFDLQGRKVRTLVSGVREASAGHAIWDGLDDAGAPVRNGAYFARLAVADQRLVVRKVSIAR